MFAVKSTLKFSKQKAARIRERVAQERKAFRQLVALRKHYTLGQFAKDELLGPTVTAVKQ